MRRSRYYVLVALILAILVAVLVVKILLPSRLFRKAVLSPIPKSVKSIRK